ncbi:MAG: hypothetical protein FJ146_03925 [Deltaproteobacteria bacterium]|nr:hypothetical protein [Deltaproteobacteria bacterium]
MTPWENDPAFAQVEELARKIEKAVAATNEALMKLAKIEPQRVVETYAQVQAQMLGFDSHATKNFLQALEDKRVNTHAMGNMFVACVMTAAVALSEFKNQPLAANAGYLRRRMERLRHLSTNGVTLAAFSWASFHAVLGQGAAHQIKSWRQHRSFKTG